MHPSVFSTPAAQAILHESRWQKFVKMVLHRRVRITVILFVVLVGEDVIERVDPHSLTNYRDYHSVLGIALILLGLGMRSWAAGTLKKRTQLATSGPYQLMRHPLYAGSLCLMLGFCSLIDDPENIVFILGPMLLMYIVRAIHEEKSLATLFPDEWSDYIRQVPRFLPRRLPTAIFADWSWEQWQKNREYQAVVAVLLGLAGVQVWQAMI